MSSFAKSGRNWTQNNLNAYNIKVVGRDEEEFFGGITNKIPASITRSFLEHDIRIRDHKVPKDAKVLEYLYLADLQAGEKWSRVCDFPRSSLNTLAMGAKMVNS